MGFKVPLYRRSWPVRNTRQEAEDCATLVTLTIAAIAIAAFALYNYFNPRP